LLSPVEFDRAPVLARAAAALRVGGTFLLVDHGSLPPWADPGAVLPTPRELLNGIGLDLGRWEVVRTEHVERGAGHASRRHTRDTIVHLIRREADTT